MDWAAQVFGGCCVNVFLVEAIISTPSAEKVDYGPAITVFQFLFTAIFALPPLLDFSQGLWRRGFLKPTRIPKNKVMIMVLMHFASSIANNAAWKYGVSVPVHSMFRSCGTVLSLTTGYLFGGKRYTSGQVLSCILMSVGILGVITQRTVDSPNARETAGLDHVFMIGILLLFIGSILGTFLGLYTEKVFEKYGSHWQESLFFLHFFSLPLFLLYADLILLGLKSMLHSQQKLTIIKSVNLVAPRQLAFLLLNCTSQVICARGVNKLTSYSTALTISVVLMLRKFASLVISALFFGNRFNTRGLIGSAVLIAGSIQYAYSSSQAQKGMRMESAKKKK